MQITWNCASYIEKCSLHISYYLKHREMWLILPWFTREDFTNELPIEFSGTFNQSMSDKDDKKVHSWWSELQEQM